MFKNLFLKRHLSINQCRNQLFLFRHFNEFLILNEFVHRFGQTLRKCRFFNKNSCKSTENVCEQLDTTETNNGIRLLIFDNKSQFLFFQPNPFKKNCNFTSLKCFIQGVPQNMTVGE